MSGQVTPEPTPRLVIPYGDRPIIDPRTGTPTYEMYQWMQRINRGVATNITNIDTTINQLNVDTTNITNIDTDLTVINTEIEELEAQVDLLQGRVVFLLSQSGPPPPSESPASGAFARGFSAPFPPPPARWPGAGNFVQLESHGVPEKISAMPDLDITVNVDGTQKIAAEEGATDNLGIALSTFYTLFASWDTYGSPNPLDDTGSGAAPVNWNAGNAQAASNNPGQSATMRGGAGDGSGAGGNINLLAGAGGDTANGGHAWLISGDGGATSGDSGEIRIATGAAPAGTRASITVDAFSITTPPGQYLQMQTGDETVALTNSQDFFFFTGAPGTGGDSGAANYGTGDNNVGGNTGAAFLYTGNATSGNSGGAFVGSGNASATSGDTAIYTGDGADSGLIGISTGVAATGNSGNIGLKTGNATVGNSGNIAIEIGTAAGTQGVVLAVNWPTSAAGLPANALWVDTGAGNVIKRV